ncbi:hypothetical protein EDB81DRAFT_757045 [Dactylonectria macrodidyma]|uniref:MADS-box MEF2 type transcription factor MIG1 n=1 Tax=Dactylonectria macrodidyma TaxID=307937 RepID=A0A9P9JDJ2_9HYPO|nr:hypothetical protein EDB81DRAFT_757045 [Dactylonectria macrodidyma]
MGRRKIEIKAIKDDRNRSVTFLKRKGGLFKKAHELSVLCSVDVAVFIFGNNKKLYEYSSSDMRDLITRYQYHGGPNEHKGPSDFNGGNDDEEEEEADGTPPHAPDDMNNQMMPPHFHGPQPPFPQIRHHTPSASPPIGTNGGHFQAHPGHPGHPGIPVQRGHTPQPSIGSRPGSRNDMRRMGPGPGMASQPGPPPGPPHPGISYMPTPPIYNPPPPLMAQQQAPQYAYGQQQHPQQQQHQQQQHQQQHPQQQQPQQPQQPPQHHPQQQPYPDDRRPPMPPTYHSQAPQHEFQAPSRPEPSPQPNHQQLPLQPPIPQISPPPPQPPQHPQERRLQDPPPPPPAMPKLEPMERPQRPIVITDSAIKKLPQRKSHSIFTPIEENRSILSQHLASFASEPIKTESGAAAAAANAASRAQSVDVGAINRANHNTSSPPIPPPRANTNTTDKTRTVSMSSIPETTLTPPSRSNSLQVAGGARPRGPRLTVQIPAGASEAGGSETAESNSPRNPTETAAHPPQRHNSQSSLVLPPPSPSASALLSAGATGPPNPFARPPPQQTVNGGDNTPVSALPSRFLNNEFLPSPSSFYPEWNFRGGDSNTLPSPLNFATPVVGSGPSFLRDDGPINPVPNNSNLSVSTGNTAATKRKTPEYGATHHSEATETADAKRVKVE